MTILRTNSDSPDFQLLAAELERHLRARDGDLQEYYAQLNRIGSIPQVLVAYNEDRPIGCGAIREYEEGKAEIKRMYVRPANRGNGIATRLLEELENWAREGGCTACVLETGLNQPEAIAFYQKNGYRIIPLFGRYIGSPNSVCFQKEL
ncbi:MAG TPA: GNAT family N-acetyltransferase [Puia sp.]|uniref:GNAT family N-acetyltransferase n=1 Tax=Puia sp. TaxID=2045100 RepID=UPI002D03F821|nr:GNAT family N-acetyltransferase [Puia sp.]HVU96153.1 GNAT family N-acetyltransferase [Puia sp.]